VEVAAALAGLAALWAAIIEAGKKLGIVKDGTAGIWALVGDILIYAVGQFANLYGWDLARLDNFAQMLAELILMVVGMFIASVVTHKVGREGNLPLFRKA